MLDRQGIYKRFSECYGTETPVELAKLLGLHRKTVYQWKSGARQVPWKKLKTLVANQNISWDWLLEGSGPKILPYKVPDTSDGFIWHDINQRFLSLFPGMTQAKLGKLLGVSQVTVSYWRHDQIHVPWDKLKFAVDQMDVTWNWLLNGL